MPRRVSIGTPDSEIIFEDDSLPDSEIIFKPLSPQARNAATLTVPKIVLQKFAIIFEVFGDAMYSLEGTSDYFGLDENGEEIAHDGVWMDVFVQVGSFQWLGQPFLELNGTGVTRKFEIIKAKENSTSKHVEFGTDGGDTLSIFEETDAGDRMNVCIGYVDVADRKYPGPDDDLNLVKLLVNFRLDEDSELPAQWFKDNEGFFEQICTECLNIRNPQYVGN